MGLIGLSGLCHAKETMRRAAKPTMISSPPGKDADPDIPILRQAKAEHKKLTATASAAASASGKKAIAPFF
jgi:hypothetical protein